MDEIRSSSSPPVPINHGTGCAGAEYPPPPPTGSSKKQKRSTAWSVKKHCLAFMVSVQERFEYVKAFFVGQAKKLRARSEEEATEADLQAAKVQVEAADAAEDAKTRLHKSA